MICPKCGGRGCCFCREKGDVSITEWNQYIRDYKIKKEKRYG